MPKSIKKCQKDCSAHIQSFYVRLRYAHEKSFYAASASMHSKNTELYCDNVEIITDSPRSNGNHTNQLMPHHSTGMEEGTLG